MMALFCPFCLYGLQYFTNAPIFLGLPFIIGANIRKINGGEVKNFAAIVYMMANNLVDVAIDLLEEVLYSDNLEERRAATNAEAAADVGDKVSGVDFTLGEEFLNGATKNLALALAFLNNLGKDAIGERKLAGHARLVGQRVDWDRAAECRKIARGLASKGVRNESFDGQLLGCANSSLCEASRHLTLYFGHRNVIAGVLSVFRHTGNLGHGLYGLDWVFTISGLAAEHNGVGAVVDGVCDIGDLGAGRARVLDHRVEHLRGHDDGLLRLDALADEHALDERDALNGHLDAEVSTSHHDAIYAVKNLVYVVDALLVLNLGNDLDRAVVSVEDVLNLLDVFCAAHEGVGNEVELVLNGPKDETLVLLGKRWQLDAYARDVDALAAILNAATVLNCADEVVALLCVDMERDLAIVNEDLFANRKVVNETCVGDAEELARRVLLRIALDDNLLAGLEYDGLVAWSGANLGTLGVYENCDFVRNLTSVLYDATDTLMVHMGRVAADNVHTGLMELADELYIATNIGNRCDDFC